MQIRKGTTISSHIVLFVLTLIAWSNTASGLIAQDTLWLEGWTNKNLQQLGETNVWADYSTSFLEPSSQNPKLLIDMVSQGFLLLEEIPIALSEYEKKVRGLTRYRDTLLKHQIVMGDFSGQLMKGITGRGEAAEIFWLMYFGDESRVFDLKGGYLLSNDDNLSPQILHILESVRWKEPSVFDELPYALATDSLQFHVEKAVMPNTVRLEKIVEKDTITASAFYSVGQSLMDLQLNEAEGKQVEFEHEGIQFTYAVFDTKEAGKAIKIWEGNARYEDKEVGIIAKAKNASLLEAEIKALIQTVKFK